MRYLASILLLCLASVGFSVVTTTTYDLTAVTPSPVNTNLANFATTAQEDVLVIKNGSIPRKLEFLGTADWTTSSTTASANKTTILGTQTNVLKLPANSITTLYVKRVSADGTVTCRVLE